MAKVAIYFCHFFLILGTGSSLALREVSALAA